MTTHRFAYFVLLAVLLCSCQSKTVIEDFQIDQGFDYFPLEIGKYIEYEVDSILYDTTGTGVVTEEIRKLVREEVVDTFRDNNDRLVYSVERWERNSEAESWAVKSVKSVIPTQDQLETIEDNLRFIKLVFPLKDGELWDGNQFIDPTTIVVIKGESVEVFKSWSYEVQSLGESETINDKTFDEVATITQAESENVIELRYSVEKYARGVGLVYKEMKILDTQCIVGCEGLPWEEKAQKGFILRQSIIGHN